MGIGTEELIGKQIGVYRIDSLLGAGGMGEVYRARDSKLGRDVAIKVLPAAFLIDPERRARFDREARMLATLNHPNIGAIYGFEESDGLRALVLELIEGDTLAERIVREPIPLDEVLRIARGMAEALDAAHDKGIVHRDLKPANIKLTPSGSVKVLDFGLAKAMTDDGRTGTLTDSPTVTVGGTRSGLLLGTAAYMSPEQARGKPVDRRTDIWAFGCVVYQMLARRPAFGGESVSDTLVAVLDRDPDWSALPASMPEWLRRLLRRCLEKDPARRLRDIGDARLELDDRSEPASIGSTDSVPAGRDRFRAPITGALAMGVVALAAAGAVVWWFATRTPIAPEPIIRATLNLPADQELDTQPTASPLALSPDGRRVAYVARSEGRYQLYVRNLDAFDAKPLPGTEGARYPFFSPDGESIAFFAGGKLKKVSIVSGSPIIVCDAPSITRGGSWSSLGFIVVPDPGGTGLMKVPASGGVLERVAINNADTEKRYLAWPHFLPDGRRLLISTSPVPTWSVATRIAILSVETGEWTPLGDGSQAQYIGSGHIVFHAPHVREGELQTIELDL